MMDRNIFVLVLFNLLIYLDYRYCFSTGNETPNHDFTFANSDSLFNPVRTKLLARFSQYAIEIFQAKDRKRVSSLHKLFPNLQVSSVRIFCRSQSIYSLYFRKNGFFHNLRVETYLLLTSTNSSVRNMNFGISEFRRSILSWYSSLFRRSE